MGAHRVEEASEDAARPLWVRLCRVLNRERVCAVADCIALTDPGIGHCPTHLRDLRADLGPYRCAEPTCVQSRVTGDELCAAHGEAAFIDSCSLPVQGTRWNSRPGPLQR
ncbi:hypothetical protein [Nocardiopsis ansamitocini]|nr:hypothetical protein [Nocardiopsis ansamitocini]